MRTLDNFFNTTTSSSINEASIKPDAELSESDSIFLKETQKFLLKHELLEDHTVVNAKLRRIEIIVDRFQKLVYIQYKYDKNGVLTHFQPDAALFNASLDKDAVSLKDADYANIGDYFGILAKLYDEMEEYGIEKSNYFKKISKK